MESASDEFPVYKPNEDELTLYHLSAMVHSILEQLTWLGVIIDQEIKRKEEDSTDF